ncbi:[FeFe] hydrogenase H-cluster maturation GTPase HydF [Breznakibacter xylanolyticus]|uniref:[FeFe] hydrogenase H-cluster maturation GTPase HydF n=1 Tax=Breznakibacter xylanolyticus TaxID=990 RepID=A0A2W7NKI3_9BACT|nr:[FeFe] hydrogenase H-cluster maturation GTPase HydF [Breznakibacter xylanolyticus]PZX11802.1 [FeFe] hydrogenase H-cluster maturation GTPase HydF [Breznakibacter xylanolyticus]
MPKDRHPHIGIYGRRNNGKSTLINRLAGQDVAIVSNVPGTTTDPVKKSLEITGFGPVVLVDTAGIDDHGELGLKRVNKTHHSLSLIDLAVVVIANNCFDDLEAQLIQKIKHYDIPFIVVANKSDQQPLSNHIASLCVSAGALAVVEFNQHASIDPVVSAIQKAIPEASFKNPPLLGDLIHPNDIVLLITPIDIAAPEGRMILPQVQAIRDTLDNDAVCIVLKETQVDAFLKNTAIQPAIAITDSQVFDKANQMIPPHIPLTSFSIMLARFKGDFENYKKGTPHISMLNNGDRVLILESCTHHTTCDDIGRVKIPRWMRQFTGKELDFDVVAGLDAIPRPINQYALLIQCGGCMITRKQILNRLKPAIDAGIPVTNYGMAIAWMHGIYQRAIKPFNN